MDIAVIGGGINGVMSAWALAKRGHAVTLLERGRLMGETSGASTKLLHGGLRYLEHGSFRLVREALRERKWWFEAAPDLCRPLEITIPVYDVARRPGWIIGTGLALYHWLAGRQALGRPRRLTAAEVLARRPDLRAAGLLGGWSFVDGMMVDDAELGRRAAEWAVKAGVQIREQTPVDRLATDGTIWLSDGPLRFDAVVNSAGPWSDGLLERSHIPARFSLDYVRGSHLVLNEPCRAALLLEYPWDKRVFFVLPYQDGTLLGTTEVRQEVPDGLPPSSDEIEYLLRGYRHYFASGIDVAVRGVFSGVRPLIRSNQDPSSASREYAIDVRGKVLTIFGGKWTTARALGEHVAERIRGLLTEGDLGNA